MSKKRFKQYLMLLTVVGLVAVAAGGSGTFASFTAQVTNPGNTFASGTLFLHDNGGTNTCTSESGNLNVNPGTGVGGDLCDTLFTADLSNGATTADLTLTNAGSIDAAHMKFDVANCTFSDNFAQTNSHQLFIALPGNCAGLYITVQEVDASGGFPGTNIYCAYGPVANATDCAAPNNTHTLNNVTSLTNLLTTGAATATLSHSQPSAGATPTRYYVITIDPTGVGSGNALQNLSVSFDLNWQLTQV